MIPAFIGGIERLISRYDNAVTLRNHFRSLMQDCYRYAVPDRDMFNSSMPGQRNGTELFDSTATAGVQEFASRIQANICPPWRQWSKLVGGPGLPKEMRDADELSQYLEEQTDILFEYINHSNFALKSHEGFQDLAVGTGALTLELNEQRNGLVFDSIPPAQLALEEGPTGMIETVFMDRKMAVSQIERKYPGATLPDKWVKLAKDKPTEQVEFIVACVYDPKTQQYHFIAFTKQEKAVLYSRNYGESCPIIVFRWSNVAGEVWGRGPVMSALPNIKTLNKVVEFTLRGAALGLAPPMTAVSDGVLNPYTAQILPNGIIPVMSNDQSNPTLRPLGTDYRPDLAQLVLEDLRMTVKQQLFTDPRRKDGPIQSATEILVEDRDFVQRIGASFGRIQSEFTTRVIARAVFLLKSIGKMADFKVDGREISLKHMSPLARAQDQEELLALQTAIQSVAPFGPEALQMAVKIEDIGEWIFRRAGVDATVLRSDAERAKIKEQLAQAAQAMAAQQAPAAA